jgi:hypothetical protein
VIPNTAQILGFALAQTRGRRQLSKGVQLLDPDGDVRYVTSVLRVPDDIAQVVTGVVRALPGVAGHYLYPSADLHLTVLNLDSARQTTVEDRAQAAESALHDLPTFPVKLAGIGVSQQSVYVRAYDPTGSLWRLRGRLASATGCHQPVPRRLLGFVNVVRFTRPCVADLLKGLSSLRPASLGTFDVSAVEVVHTDKVLSTAETIVIRRIAMTGRSRAKSKS